MKTQRVHVWGHFSAPGLFRVWRVAREWYVNDRTWGCSWRCQGQVSHPLRLDFSGSVWFTKCPACISTFSKSLVLHQTKIELLIPMCHWPSQEPKLEAYVREYHHKIWPKIWYSTSILGSWNSHWPIDSQSWPGKGLLLILNDLAPFRFGHLPSRSMGFIRGPQ